MFVAILLFIGGVIAACFGGLLLFAGLANTMMLVCSLLCFLIAAVSVSGSFIIGAIMDLEKAVKAAPVEKLRS